MTATDVTNAPATPASAQPIPVPAPASNFASPAVTVESATPSVDAKPSKWKDGKFAGWGSCRHGDIEATVVIKDGRIVSAVVSSCQTGYSCDVIDSVIPQVVIRQSPDIDSVSGSTQSADAFYWAVASALAEAELRPGAAK